MLLWVMFVMFADAWDAVVSCFFLDTAPNIIEYLEVVKQILRPGGYLINFGSCASVWGLWRVDSSRRR